MAQNGRIVISFGRFNPPHKGYESVFRSIQKVAHLANAEALVFPGPSEDPKRNPLKYNQKLYFLRQMYPWMNFAPKTGLKDPIDVLSWLSHKGYKSVYLVVGSDRVADMKKLARYIKPVGKGTAKTDIELNHYEVVPIPRNTEGEGVAGMSATKVRDAVRAGDYDAYRAMVPGTEPIKREMYNTLRRNMGIHESFKRPVSNRPKAFLVYGTTPRNAACVMEAFNQLPVRIVTPRTVRLQMRTPAGLGVDPVCVDVSGHSYVDVKNVHSLLERAGFAPTVYVRAHIRTLNENVVRNLSNVGLIQRGLARDVVEVATANPAAASREVFAHARNIMEAEGTAPKVPSEVDRLKIQQKREQILNKERQAQELLGAQMRELQKKAREDQEKVQVGTKPKTIAKA